MAMKKYASVDDYVADAGDWQNAVALLRDIMLSTEVEEALKWSIPTYTVKGKNVVGLAAFKKYVGIWFHQGVFLNDEAKKLVNAQEGVTKALRQWRFNSIEEIQKDRYLIKAYVEEAIENQKAGKEIKPERKLLVIPPELQELLDKNPELNDRFEAYTVGKKREFADYISEAKRAETKQKRLAKVEPLIMRGIGLNDRYRS